MRIVIAPDKFKGSLSAGEAAAAIARGLRAELAALGAPAAEILELPMADGGEGTLDAAIAAGFEAHGLTASGPLGAPVWCRIALRAGSPGEAIVELAEASGLKHLAADKRDALRAHTFGTGELIRRALDLGAERIVLAIGGSASTDGGTGMLAALGARFLDAAGSELPLGGGALAELAEIDLAGLDPRIARTEFVLASDVDNPLTGPNGAAAVFGPQKGASPADVKLIDAALAKLARVARDAEAAQATRVAQTTRVAGSAAARPPAQAAKPHERKTDQAAVARQAATPDQPHRIDPALAPGSGAAGGVGFAALAFLGAARRPGAEFVGELLGVAEAIAIADLVITGEGSFDAQSLAGKAPAWVARVSRQRGATAVLACGRLDATVAERQAAGFAAAYPLTAEAASERDSIERAAVHLEAAARKIARHHLAVEPGD